MDQHGGDGGGGRSSSRLRDRLARMFRPGTLLRSACNTTASASTGTGTTSANSRPPPASALSSSSRALLAADADSVSFLASSRRDHAAAVGRAESFSTAVDRLHRRGAAVAPAPPPSRFSVDNQPPPPLLETNKEKTDKSPRDRLLIRNDKTPKTVKMLSNDPYGFSTSDDNDTDDAEDLAGVRGGAKKLAAGETTSFFSSSRSFSSDSSEFYTTKKNKTTKASKITARTSFPAAPAPPPPKPPLPPSSRAKSKEQQRRHRRVASSCDTCGVRDGFRPAVVSAAEEQLRKGFAVVKRSRDPYADFKSSMVEMIVGRQLFGAPDLERLLRSYLSLNAPRHHPVILQAFSDIWVVLHGG